MSAPWMRVKNSASKRAKEAYNAALDAGATEEEANAAADTVYQDYIEGWGDAEFDRQRDRGME